MNYRRNQSFSRIRIFMNFLSYRYIESDWTICKPWDQYLIAGPLDRTVSYWFILKKWSLRSRAGLIRS
ncbi:hypothetical protein TWF225_010089 [Orbilia oligospora]|nr:hypothetical protein TWF751_001515 [Orbilia oligospora]KAF3193328.1 hypothetical protein TWF225_010089 [Orbilia oligospora]KAF3241311.1 hypothetical protein TWF128_011027 [Orbilia oligospora]KAF3249289.1 hypothetical protein TWF217_008888 [Orbilia oligospora]KAF3296364.1 hypothetical protein TWF132_010960 [Orbilia oligospora]